MSEPDNACEKGVVTFANSKGERFGVNVDLTIRQLLKMGVESIRITTEKDPVKNGEWVSET